MLKLNAFDTVTKHENGFKVELCLPNGEPAFLDCDAKKPKKRLAIIIKGNKSSDARNEMLKMLREAKKADKDENELNYEDLAERASKKMAKLTVGWENIPTWSGDGVLDFTEDDAFRLYNSCEEIREQIIKAHEKEENFI